MRPMRSVATAPRSDGHGRDDLAPYLRRIFVALSALDRREFAAHAAAAGIPWIIRMMLVATRSLVVGRLAPACALVAWLAALLAVGTARCCAGRRRPGVPEMARELVAAGAEHGRVAPDLRGRDARRRARPDAARSRSAGTRRRAAARPGRVRADPGRLHQGDQHRAACRAGQEARRRSQPYARRDRAAVRRAAQRAARDLGA